VNELDWTEKYRPKRLSDVLGNDKAISELRKWAESWEKDKPIKKGVILAGPAGTGKTSSAIALANEFGWSLVELNASDARNMTIIRQVATTGAMNQTFSKDGEYLQSTSGGRKLIVLDEADSLYERSATAGTDKIDVGDRGGKRAIIDTLDKARQPIILIVNDLYALTKGSGAALKNSTITIRFYKLREATIRKAIRNIAEKEKIKVTPEVTEALARKAGGDLRACINDFQSLSIGRSAVSINSMAALGGRDMTTTIFDAVRDVFRGTSTSRIRKTFYNVDETPDNILLWIDENLPLEYKRPPDLASGFDMISRADVFLGRIRRRQHYRFYSYAKDLMTAGVAAVKQHSYSGWAKYNFPSWLKKMSQSKESRALYKMLSLKIGIYSHVSSQTVRSDLIIPFRYLFKNDMEFAVNMSSELDLDSAEIAFLYNEKQSSNRVKILLEELKRLKAAKGAGDNSVEIFTPAKGRGGKKKTDDSSTEKSKSKKRDKSEKSKKSSSKKGKSKKSDKEDESVGPAIAETADSEAGDDENGQDEGDKIDKKKEIQKSLFDF
jgi:replication factor C large subunit